MGRVGTGDWVLGIGYWVLNIRKLFSSPYFLVPTSDLLVPSPYFLVPSSDLLVLSPQSPISHKLICPLAVRLTTLRN